MKKKLFLTFDDGPDRVNTPRLLDLLKKYDIKASFFTVGEFVKENREIILRMKQEGHSIQLHGNRHISVFFRTKKGLENDMDQAVNTLMTLGISPKYFRPPWGHTKWFSKIIAKERGMKLIKWDVMAEDWKGNISSDEICRRILQRVFPGSVICLHDGRGKNNAPERTIAALIKAIPILLERGYQFEILE